MGRISTHKVHSENMRPWVQINTKLCVEWVNECGKDSRRNSGIQNLWAQAFWGSLKKVGCWRMCVEWIGKRRSIGTVWQTVTADFTLMPGYSVFYVQTSPQAMAPAVGGHLRQASWMSAASGAVIWGGWRCIVPLSNLPSQPALSVPSATLTCPRLKR
jgi:hypothetical protein